jgi:membrane protein EpsK
MGMGGWVVVNRVGGLLLQRVDLLVVNAVFGAAMTGSYGAILQFSILTQTLGDTATSVLKPIIFRKYGQGDSVGLKPLTSQAVKLLGLALALPVGLLCGFSQPLLSIWLGPSFEDLNILLILTVVHLSLSTSVLPLNYVQTAYNKVRWPSIITLLSGGANLGLAILLAKWGGWGVLGVAVAGAIVWTARSALYTPLYVAHIMKLPWWTFLPSLSASIIGTSLVGIIAYGLTLVRMPGSWLTLAGSAAVVSLLYIIGVGVIGLNRTDWQLLQDLFPRRGRV